MSLLHTVGKLDMYNIYTRGHRHYLNVIPYPTMMSGIHVVGMVEALTTLQDDMGS
jgi:hypothetical protein